MREFRFATRILLAASSFRLRSKISKVVRLRGRALCFHRVIHHSCEKETRETTHWRRQNFLYKISKKSFYHIYFIYLEKCSAVSIYPITKFSIVH